ncbi:ICP34.5 regulation protein [Human alphaherpesvirus 2]|nr:ICP34.5 regulation protein [Human alphaherpesvirus 2]ATB17390.1 ICP34.5 regulation protein [Human alphaherpesvirus 2]
MSRRRPRRRGPRRRPRPGAPAVPRPGALPTADSQMVPAYDSGTAVESAPAASSLLRRWLLVPQADDSDDADYAGNDDAEWANSPPSEGGGKAPEAPHAAPAAACPPPPPRKERGPQRPLPPHLALRLRTTTEYLARLSLRRRRPPASPPADAPRGKVQVRHLVAWETAARLARRGSWARERADRDRFRRRVAAAEAVIGPCLEPEARARARARARAHEDGGPAEEEAAAAAARGSSAAAGPGRRAV